MVILRGKTGKRILSGLLLSFAVLVLAAPVLSAQEVTLKLEYSVAVENTTLWETPEARKAVRTLHRKERLTLRNGTGNWLKMQTEDGAEGYVDIQAVEPTGSLLKKWGTPVFWRYPRRRYLPPQELSRTEEIVNVVYEVEALFFERGNLGASDLMSKALFAYYERYYTTAAGYLALAVDNNLATYRVGPWRLASRRTFSFLEAVEYESAPPIFRVKAGGRWHRFEIVGPTIRRLD